MSEAAVTVTGFIANELEVRNAGNYRVVDVSVPHTPRKFDKDRNEWVDAGETTWFSATFWEEHADVVLRTVEKGDLVTVSGQPDIEVYVKRDGNPGGKVKISNPQIAKVVRRPKRGEQPARAEPARSEPAVDSWSTPGAMSDETPF